MMKAFTMNNDEYDIFQKRMRRIGCDQNSTLSEIDSAVQDAFDAIREKAKAGHTIQIKWLIELSKQLNLLKYLR